MKPSAASIIIVNEHKKVLCIQRDESPDILFSGLWTVIGGHIEQGESPEQAAVRECLEETGLRVMQPKRFMEYESRYHTETIFYVQMPVKRKDITLREGQGFAFFGIDEIRKHKFGFQFREILEFFYRTNVIE